MCVPNLMVIQAVNAKKLELKNKNEPHVALEESQRITKVIRIHYLGIMNVTTNFLHQQLSKQFTEIQKCHLHGGARGKVRALLTDSPTNRRCRAYSHASSMAKNSFSTQLNHKLSF